MIRLSLFVVLLATATFIRAQQTGVITVNVNTTTTVNGSISNVEQESLALNYTIGEVGLESFDWNNEWSAEESGENEFELLDGAGDIIYLIPNGPNDESQNIIEILAEPAISPNGNNSTVGSYVGNALTKAYQPSQSNVTPIVNNNAPVESQQQPIAVNATAPVIAVDVPEAVEAPEVAEAAEAPEVVEAAEAPEVVEAAENLGSAVGTAAAVAAVPVVAASEAISEAAENVSEAANQTASDIVTDVEQTYENAESDVNDAQEAVENVIESPLEAAEDVASNVGEAAAQVDNDVDNVVESVEGDVNEARSVTRNVSSSFSTGYNSARNGNQ